MAAPVTTPAYEGEGRNGWYRTPVNVTLTAEDEGAGVARTFFKLNDGAVAEGTSIRMPYEGENSLRYWSKDKAGNVEEEKAATVNIDLTAPTVSFTVQDGTVYGIDQNVVIGCSADDALSGVVSSDCDEIAAEAYELETGLHTFTATAEDAAGNIANQSITISVTVDFDSLSELVARFVNADNGIRHALVKKLDQAKYSASKGNLKAMHGQLTAFIHQVNAQCGKALTEEQAQVLNELANSLK
ncbi:OmpL47-type beta-barrel domain-containing protein [Paenibacillus sp. LPE1-1-1.1]|uniref:OmpL47-type beta-barrel domain-containing protein n=1 Tax=Paenibacillus sp. LPE1-1-1.1 TaxID=3135230 RepID=UPI0039C9BA09